MTRACLVFACGDPVTTRGRCARHAGQVDSQRSLGTDRQAGAELYQSARWKALRGRLLRRSPLCACDDCARDGIVRPTSVIHHLEPHGGVASKFFAPSNLRPLAKACHDRITMRERGQGGIPSPILDNVAGCTPRFRVARVSGGSPLGADVAKGDARG